MKIYDTQMCVSLNKLANARFTQFPFLRATEQTTFVTEEETTTTTTIFVFFNVLFRRIDLRVVKDNFTVTCHANSMVEWVATEINRNFKHMSIIIIENNMFMLCSASMRPFQM